MYMANTIDGSSEMVCLLLFVMFDKMVGTSFACRNFIESSNNVYTLEILIVLSTCRDHQCHLNGRRCCFIVSL